MVITLEMYSCHLENEELKLNVMKGVRDGSAVTAHKQK